MRGAPGGQEATPTLSRAQALEALNTVISVGCTLFSLDFSGCGLSDGELISLGWYERDDVAAVVEHLRSSGRVSRIGLWGRSMGAVTALLHGERDPSIACFVLDSPFSSLSKLSYEVVAKAPFRIPSFAVTMVRSFVRSSVKKRAGFDINALAPINHADKCYIPALFAAAEGDDFIAPHHTDEMCAACGQAPR